MLRNKFMFYIKFLAILFFVYTQCDHIRLHNAYATEAEDSEEEDAADESADSEEANDGLGVDISGDVENVSSMLTNNEVNAAIEKASNVTPLDNPKLYAQAIEAMHKHDSKLTLKIVNSIAKHKEIRKELNAIAKESGPVLRAAIYSAMKSAQQKDKPSE